MNKKKNILFVGEADACLMRVHCAGCKQFKLNLLEISK